MKNFFKTITRSVKNSAAKLISIMAIIFIGIMFIAGLGTLMPTIQRSVSDYLNENNAADVIIMGAFSDSDVARLEANGNVSGVSYITSADYYEEATTQSEETSYRVYYFYGDPSAADATTLSVEGSLPSNGNEVAVERSSDYTNPHSIGDMLELNGKTYTVTAIISNPLIFSKQGEPNRQNSAVMLTDIYYFNAGYFTEAAAYYTELHVTFSALEGADRFSDSYTDKVNALTAALKTELGESYAYLTQESNASCVTLDMYVDKVNKIVLIFPLFFILVAALTVSTTMTRTVEEDRSVIGCYTTLGFSKSTIVFKYAFLAAACCIIASVSGIVIGLYLVPRVIYNGFGSTLFLPAISGYVKPFMGLIAFLAMLVVITGVTVITALKSLKCKPAVLLQPKSPRAGKKIFLEHIHFLWNRLSFKYKACARNILRYKKHFAMTVISVCGSTALVFAGFSLINRAVTNSGGGSAMGSALLPIAALVIVFAVALSAFVIYNLTNLNIGERKREIATLRVLGYTKGEVAAYIYREITVMTVIGIITGIAVGCVLIQVVFGILDMGSLKEVNWWAYVCAVLVVAIFTALVDLMLTPKINSVNMTESLKSVE